MHIPPVQIVVGHDSQRASQNRWHVGNVPHVLACLVGLAACLVGCTQRVATTGHAFAVQQVAAEGTQVTVAGDATWIDTGVDLTEGEPIAISSSGRVIVRQSDRWGQKFEASVGPDGTFLVHDGIQNQNFPLPSGNHGPAPCFSLMGRIGDGPPFFVGKAKSWLAPSSGRLQLAVNDFDPRDSEGAFHAQITRPEFVQPVGYEAVVPADGPVGQPIPGCQVVVFYVDGLRPDVVREMAAMGHIPNIRSLFLDNGVWMSNCCTGFPSDTITSNGTMWTGCFSDRHGLKGQVRFSRQSLKSQSYLDPLGPSRSARMLSPQGVDRALIDGGSTARKWIYGHREGQAWKHSLTADIAPLYDILRNEGRDWATGVLPVMTDTPPPLWSRSLARSVPYFQVQEAWRYIDDANANYAVRQLIPREQPVMIVWLPETDSVSHKECRGQFGATRRTIAKADQLIGQIVAEFAEHDRLRTTYFCLVSDHGHHGGRTGHLSHFDVAHELLYRPREIDASGRWSGGGLGLSVRQHRECARHTGDGSKQFVFIDGDSDGVARLYLPRGKYRSGDWSGPSRPADLLNYRIADHLPPVNLVDMFANARADQPAGQDFEKLRSLSDGSPPARDQQTPRDELQSPPTSPLPPAPLIPPDSILPVPPQSPGQKSETILLSHEQPHSKEATSDARHHPIDLVLMKLTDDSLLVTNADRGQAVIERRPLEQNSAGTIRWELRYCVVTNVRPNDDGDVAYEIVAKPLNDPLGLTQVVDHNFLEGFHDEQVWLRTQALTSYPDSVVTLSRHMLWQHNIAPQEADAAPDLVITARPGWYFGNDSSPGTMHGYPLADAMRACWFVSGPNVRRGARINEPCRLADLTPTLLDMVGSRVNMEHFDGHPIRSVYQPDFSTSPTPLFTLAPRVSAGLFASGPFQRQTIQTPFNPRNITPFDIAQLRQHSEGGDITLTSGNVLKAVYWDAVDLRAWRPVKYQPVPEYPHQPLTTNHPSSPYDLNNLTYNLLLFTELSIFRVMDDVISPLSFGRRPFMTATDRVDLALRHSQNEWVSESASVFDLTSTTFTDYQITSQTNWRRINAAVDYVQRRGTDIEGEIAGAAGQQRLLGSNLLNGTVDATQLGFWNAYGFGQRTLIQFLDETLIQGIENSTDRGLNAVRPMPAEIRAGVSK